jgi:hypothetical protein
MAIGEIVAGAVQGLGGLALGAYDSYKTREAKEKARKELRKLGLESDASYATMLQDLTNHYANRNSLGTAEDAQSYKELIQSYNPNDFVYDFEKEKPWEYKKTVEDFYNPYRDKIIKGTSDALQHTAAGAGLGRGTGAALNIAKGVADKDQELYNTAYSQFLDDRNTSYNQWSDYINKMQNKLNTLQQGYNTQVSMLGNLADDYFKVQDAQMADQLKLAQDREAAKASYASQIASII